MASQIGAPIPRKLIVNFYAYTFGALAIVTAITAARGVHEWQLPAIMAGLALLFLALANIGGARREFVQIDDDGVAVNTVAGVERVSWSEVRRVRILTTDEGPEREDVLFVIEGSPGKGCVVPQEAAVRTKLLEELQARLPGVQNEMIIKAMGSTDNASFTIWTKPD